MIRVNVICILVKEVKRRLVGFNDQGLLLLVAFLDVILHFISHFQSHFPLEFGEEGLVVELV